MATIIRTEKRQRGIFGTLVWWTFLAFNAFMAFWIYLAVSGASTQFQSTVDGAERAGTAIGGTLAFGFLLMLWLIGDIILGLLVILSRGKTVTTERVID